MDPNILIGNLLYRGVTAGRAMQTIGGYALTAITLKLIDQFIDRRESCVSTLSDDEYELFSDLYSRLDQFSEAVSNISDEGIQQLTADPETIGDPICRFLCMRRYDECVKNFGGNLCQLELSACMRQCDGAGGNGGSVNPNFPVTLYEDIQYGGYAMSIKVGQYPDARTIGFHDRLSSIKVKKGYSAVLWEHENFTGAHETFFASDSDIHSNPIGGDRMSSITVHKL
ncbi:Beta/Gamma crystallin [Gimesia chilikensis]|uniref:Beta/Gamma crystallin n=1 Tax=Gimesia chilikensis TaxID=2605989 RepID=A0A517W579_9PLAN|nr:beta/gamma crystallin-related protein [Gimesia chilikensis]QDU00407.1 Beta/Gamma crystallin [Gimesia chilikensis]